ncbi:MAG TPA: hypothetical protein PK014_10600 [Thermoanaerobaculia bacterium]|nr:hypothetical protein [Thermoanaerobaculia bacterium]HUM30570.1 hypothetical protein [Thermoanaerobaculia bacterium]HXK68762.1 hypothetical protein [Thermoanaerobaculia bacterium]
MDLREKSRSQRGSLEKLVAKIPGFGGYFERDTRREADALQRRYIADTLDDVRAKIQRRMASLKDLSAIGEWGKVDQTLIRVAQTIRFAEYGYAGFFDTMKVKDDTLDRIYDIDADILDQVLRLKEEDLEAMEPTALLETIRGMEEQFRTRKSIMEEVR